GLWGRRADRRRTNGEGGTRIVQWQVEREAAAHGRGAAEVNLTAEQIRQFTADGETKACAPILAVSASVRLLKRLEDDLLLIDGNADAGIGHFEGDDVMGLIENRMSGAPTGCRRQHL